MGFLPSGGFCITTSERSAFRHDGISDETLNKIIALLKGEVTKPGSAIAGINKPDVRSISIFAPPAK